MVSENDNHKPPVVLDERRGMAAQKATDSRRRESKVQADQELLRPGQPELEKKSVRRSSKELGRGCR